MKHIPGDIVSDNLRATIMAELMSGVKPSELHEKYGVSLPTISRIKRAISPDVLQKLDTDRAQLLADMLLMHVETSLEGTINIANLTKDEGWLKTQDATGVTKLYGTMSDKVVRVLETIELQKQAAEEPDHYIDEQ